MKRRSDPGPFNTQPAKLDIPKSQRSLSNDQIKMQQFASKVAPLFWGLVSSFKKQVWTGFVQQGLPPPDAHGSLNVAVVCLVGYFFKAT